MSQRYTGFLFGLGHGHYTQFLNFQECVPADYAARAEWIGLAYTPPLDAAMDLAFLPNSVRLRVNQLWHLRRGLARHRRREWEALFLAVEQLALYPLVKRYRSYFYLDLTPSLKYELRPWYDTQRRRPKPIEALRLAAFRTLYGAARGIFAMSEWAARGIMADWRIPRERVCVTLPGANLRRWPYVDRSTRQPGSPTRILMVGGEFQKKGGQLLLDWAERTRTHGWEMDIVTWPGHVPGWVADLLGHPGPDDRASATLGPRLPTVRVHCGLGSNAPTLMQLFRDADIFCLPTQADGSSIASLEAMASGLPVLVGAVGGIPELIRHGETGILLPPGDPQALAEELEHLLGDGDYRFRMGRAARGACENFYNVERQVRAIFERLDADAAHDRAVGSR